MVEKLTEFANERLTPSGIEFQHCCIILRQIDVENPDLTI